MAFAAAAAKFGKELVTKHGPVISSKVENAARRFIDKKVGILITTLNNRNRNPKKPNNRYNPLPVGNAGAKPTAFGNSPM